VILVSQKFIKSYPFTSDFIASEWRKIGTVDIIKHEEDKVVSDLLFDYKIIKRLIILNTKITEKCLKTDLTVDELYIETSQQDLVEGFKEMLKKKGCEIYLKKGEGHWGQSVSEFGLALTLCALRQIPLAIEKMKSSHQPWDYNLKYDRNGRCIRANQFCDSIDFTSGTIMNKKVRVVGAGNIASRYASFLSFMGAEVKAWDPFANDPCFHRSHSERVHHLEDLLEDAEIFVPMVPLTDGTRGLITSYHLQKLPKGCLVILVTRAEICDTKALYERVLKREIFLAADVFDKEPLPLDHPLFNCENTVLTPHMAGRTMDANIENAKMIISKFRKKYIIKDKDLN